MSYAKVIVIGTGKIARWCLSSLSQPKRRSLFHHLFFVEYGNAMESTIQDYCRDLNIECLDLPSKKEITEYFNTITDMTLVVSAANYFIFPECLIQKKNLYIINYHDALLPSYPGRNAVTWAIYNGERETGITWHVVNALIDAGDIIAQRKIDISDDMKAYELLQKSFYTASLCFEELVDKLLLGPLDTQRQILPEDRKIYLSSEVPNNGMIERSMSGLEIYRLLRSLDYAGLSIMPRPKITINGEIRQIVRYEKIRICDEVSITNLNTLQNSVSICYDDKYNIRMYVL